MAATVKHVVVDAGGFIRNAPIREIGEEIYTLPEVVSESCDKETRRRLQMLPYQLIYKTPSAEAVVFVSDFAKKTGDYRHLSVTDIRVLALTYMLAKEHVGPDSIRTEPVNKPAENIVPSKANGDQQKIAGFFLPNDSTPSDAVTLPEDLLEEGEENDEEEEEVEEEEDAAEDDEGWITPSNIHNVKSQMGIAPVEAEKTHVSVACLTTDFAMQNVLIQMGLNVISVAGMLIKQARTYVLRCFACTKITHDTMKVFCPNCGNKTLKRVAVTRDEDGKLRFYFSKRPLNTRGLKYSLPRPKGGKHGNNPMLFEDQPTPQQRMPRKTRQTVDVFDPDYVAGSSPFAVNDVTSRASKIGISGKHDFRSNAYWNKRNPNESQKRHGRRK